jgi:glycogen(starch) synthase
VAGDGNGTGRHPSRLLVCSGDLDHPRKNVRLAIEAVGLVARGGRSIALDLVGGNAEHLAEALAGLPPSVAVRRLGPRPPADVHALMRAADALLLPSLFEEWGYVGVEAALQGTPVVSLPVYPFEEMLAGGLGRCAPGMDAPAFAGAIEELLADPPGRRDVAATAERRFGLPAVGGRLMGIWAASLAQPAVA